MQTLTRPITIRASAARPCPEWQRRARTSRTFALKGRIPGCEMKILHGAGHACQIEQPWLFNRYMIEFLKKHRLFPAQAVSG